MSGKKVTIIAGMMIIGSYLMGLGSPPPTFSSPWEQSVPAIIFSLGILLNVVAALICVRAVKKMKNGEG